MKMRNAIKSLGMCFESAPTSGPSVTFLYRTDLKSET